MAYNSKVNTSDLTDFLQSLSKLDTLDRMTHELSTELDDSLEAMNNIKSMFGLIQGGHPGVNIPPGDVSNMSNSIDRENGLNVEDINNFLEASPPNMLMSNMEPIDKVDLDVILDTMRAYTEDLKKMYRFDCPEPVTDTTCTELKLNEYSNSLDELVKRLSNIKLHPREDIGTRNAVFEDKLTSLIHDIDGLGKMFAAKKAADECSNAKGWTPAEYNISSSLQYESVINKLLAQINDVTYLVRNINL